MPREIIKHSGKHSLEVSADQLQALEAWLTIELVDGFSSRQRLEAEWREMLKKYEGVPELAVRDFPIENAPNIEITLGAIASDAIYAQMIDLIFGTKPLVTCRPVPKMRDDKEAVSDAKAMQRFVNLVADSEAQVREATEELGLDDVQLGTGVLYVPWVERRKKTKTAKVLTRHPVLRAMAPEDVLVPGGSYGDTEELPWIALRFWLTKHELNERAKVNGWETEGVQTAGAKDWVRTRRETLGKHLEGVSRKAELYDMYDIYCYFDIDGDGEDEDLYVNFNLTGRKVVKVVYNPCDRRPIEKTVYQRRAHLWYGLGVMKMMVPYQEEMTELHSYQVLNALLANCRVWVGKDGHVDDDMKIWPGKIVTVPEPDKDLRALELADVYPSMLQIQMMCVQLAEKRVGVNEMSMGRQSGMGNRTPGITAISMLQQVNKRFTPAFDGIRNTIAKGLKQCVYRYGERVLAGDKWVIRHISKMIGDEDGGRVVRVLRDEMFDENIVLELSASSASVNRESDRQNAMILVNILSQYYQRTLELVAIASNPETPEEVRAVAKKIASSAGELIDRTIRTFDQVRDPAAFVIEIEEELEGFGGDEQGGILEGIMGLLGGEGAEGAGGAGGGLVGLPGGEGEGV